MTKIVADKFCSSIQNTFQRRIKIPNPKQRSLFVSNLQIGTLYAYRVMAVNKWGTSKPRTAEFKIKLESIDEDDRSGSIWFGPHSNMNSLVDIDQPQHYSQQQTIQVFLLYFCLVRVPHFDCTTRNYQ